MSISKFVFGENVPLLTIGHFSHGYSLKVVNEFMMGKENPPILVETHSRLLIEQRKEDKYIFSNIYLKEITGTIDNDTLTTFLDQTLALAGISPVLDIKRDLNGKILTVENKEKLRNDWEKWKEETLPTIFPNETDQTKFVANYENGLKDFEQSLKKNLQYIFLLPEIYSVIFPPNKYFLFLYNESQLTSRLIENMEYLYQMKLVKLEEENDLISLELQAVLNNKDSIGQKFLQKIYTAHSEFSINDFNFKIEIKYTFEKSTARIISGDLIFKEMLHKHLSYSIMFTLVSE